MFDRVEIARLCGRAEFGRKTKAEDAATEATSYVGGTMNAPLAELGGISAADLSTGRSGAGAAEAAWVESRAPEPLEDIAESPSIEDQR